jgi:alpha-glucosidase (family GH31 glycosyl hydrolase)
MKKIKILIVLFILSINVVAQNNINSPYWKLEKTFNFPNKSKNQLFILAEKFIDYGWQPNEGIHHISIDEFETENSPKTENTSKNEYDLNKVIQLENKEQGIIKCHILSAFETRFHSPFVKSIWFEYNVKLIVNKKGDITIEISELKADEFVSNEQKMSGMYRNQMIGLERELLRIPDQLNEFILKN